jgi:hypothetical protein
MAERTPRARRASGRHAAAGAIARSGVRFEAMNRPIALAAALLLTLSAVPVLAQADPRTIAVLASSELTMGENRFLFSLTDQTGTLVAAPDVDVHLEFYDLDTDPNTVVFEDDARFLWAIEDVRGLYAADVTFPDAGRWGTLFHVTFPDGTTDVTPQQYEVLEEGSTPAIGSPAPPIDTPTAADVGGDLSRISSDPDPEPRFYERSILDAIEAHEPAVIAFVTPAFCQSATCGPTIDKVKAVAASHPTGVDFVQVEPYLMEMKDGSLQPLLSEEGWLQPAPWTELYGLRTEPFVIVIDAEGLVRAKFEGAITVDELEDALRKASTPL